MPEMSLEDAKKIEASLKDYQAVIHYLDDKIGTGVLDEEAEHHMVSEYATERYSAAINVIQRTYAEEVYKYAVSISKCGELGNERSDAESRIDSAENHLDVKLLPKFRDEVIDCLLGNKDIPWLDGNKTVTLNLNVMDHDGIVVDGTTAGLTIDQISDIVDHAAQAIIIRRGNESKPQLDAVMDELEEALTVAQVI